MKQKNNLMVLALVMVSSLLMTTLMVQASGNSIRNYLNANNEAVQLKTRKISVCPQTLIQAHVRTTAQISKVIDPSEELQLDEVNEEVLAEIDTLIGEYEKIPEEERPIIPGVWVIVARGCSWKTNAIPQTSETAPESIPIGTKFYAKAILGNIEWTLYRLGRGIIGHDGERYQVDGYALYKKATGRFYLVLDGDGVSLQAVGRVYGHNTDFATANCYRCLHLAMKGRMSVNGEGYVFAQKGFAYRLTFLRAIAVKDADIQDTI